MSAVFNQPATLAQKAAVAGGESQAHAFKLGINMAGAVSAGAYTAGVLDFLFEALDAWQMAKDSGEPVPRHDVSLEVLSGASAGGMCAAITAAMLQDDFASIQQPFNQNKGTNNRLYESWVNRIDIRQLLTTRDLGSKKQTAPLVSLLDSTVIQDIAKYALTAGKPVVKPRKWLSPNLTLFLSLTNLRGVPYSLNGKAPGSIEETTFFYGDRIRFEILGTGKAAVDQSAWPLNLSNRTAPGWALLGQAAIATGAFPMFLAPQVLNRKAAEYTPPRWEDLNQTPPSTISPDFPGEMPPIFQTLNVDGGVTNNDPFSYANQYLEIVTGTKDEDGMDAGKVTHAVISIAPFPTIEKFDAEYDPAAHSGIFSVFMQLVGALISQSRFFGESLDQIMEGTTFDRFVIAPTNTPDPLPDGTIVANPRKSALQCGSLQAFGGFFSRGFRAHDYALGRRNCQRFLRDHFILPHDNPLLAEGLKGLDMEALRKTYGRTKPETYGQEKFKETATAEDTGKMWLPVVPLCSDKLRARIPLPEPVKLSAKDLSDIIDLIFARARAVVGVLLAGIPNWALRNFLALGQPIIRNLARKPLTDALISGLGDDYEANP